MKTERKLFTNRIRELLIYLLYIFENIFQERKVSPQPKEIAQEIVNLGLSVKTTK